MRLTMVLSKSSHYVLYLLVNTDHVDVEKEKLRKAAEDARCVEPWRWLSKGAMTLGRDQSSSHLSMPTHSRAWAPTLCRS